MDEMTTGISIIIPMYNLEKYLGQAITSILGQTFTDFELICVNDGSLDATADIVRQFARNDNRITLLEQQNAGAANARNTGFAHAKGKYVMFLDGDDWFEPQMFEKMHAAAEQYEAEIVMCNHTRISEGTNAFRFPDFPETVAKAGNPFSFKESPEISFGRISPAPWVYFYRKSFIDKLAIRFQSIPRNNDFFFTMSALAAADRIARVDDRLVFHLLRQKDNLQSGNDATPTCIIEAGNAWKRQLQQWGLLPLYEKRICELVLCEATVILNKIHKFSAYKQLFDATKVFLAENPSSAALDLTKLPPLTWLFVQAKTAEDYLISVKDSILADCENVCNERDAIQLACERNAELLENALESKSYRLGHALLHPLKKLFR